MMFRSNAESLSHAQLLTQLSISWRSHAQLARLRAKPRQPNERFEFAVLGDAEPGRFWIFRALFNQPGVFQRQLASIQDQAVDFSVQLGDMVSCGHARNYLKFFRQLNEVRVTKPYLTVIGNHDRSNPHGGSHSRMYRALFGRSNYFFDYGGVRFVTLDSSRGRLTQLQLRWLRMVLHTRLRKVVFTHMPPVALRLWGGAAAHRMGGFERGAQPFTELMTMLQVERVYMGHVHCFGVQDYKGVRYVLTGGGGSPLFPSGASDKFHHYLTVSVSPSGILERVHSLDGSSFAVPPGKVVLSS